MVNRLTVTIVTACICLIVYFSGVLPGLSMGALDLLFQLRGNQQTSQTIVIVAVDEESIKTIGPWPFPRALHASLLARLNQARAVAFDILFHDPSPDDPLFRQAIESGPPIGLAVADDFDGHPLSPHPDLGAGFAQGHIHTLLGSDGIVRQVDICPSQGPPALARSLTQAAGWSRPCPAGKAPLLINFYGPEFAFPYLSYADVSSGKIPADFFRDRLVLVGMQAQGLGDVHVTPFSRHHPMPGVEIQATVLNNLLDDSFIRPLSSLSRFCAAALLLLGLVFWPQRSETGNLILTIAAAGSICLVSLALIFQDRFLDPALPLLVLVAGYVSHLIVQGIWLTFTLISETRHLDRQLEEGLRQIYTTIPAHLTRSKDRSNALMKLPGSIARHIGQMQEGIKALSLQNHFIEHLLSKETPPLILWEKSTGAVILVNTSFTLLWPKIRRDEAPPLLQAFLDFVNTHQTGEPSAPRGNCCRPP